MKDAISGSKADRKCFFNGNKKIGCGCIHSATESAIHGFKSGTKVGAFRRKNSLVAVFIMVTSTKGVCITMEVTPCLLGK